MNQLFDFRFAVESGGVGQYVLRFQLSEKEVPLKNLIFIETSCELARPLPVSVVVFLAADKCLDDFVCCSRAGRINDLRFRNVAWYTPATVRKDMFRIKQFDEGSVRCSFVFASRGTMF